MIDSRLPRHEARRLWAKSEGDIGVFQGLEQRRLEGEPLQYLEGTAAFGPLDLVVDPRVLIPRPETEQLWEMVTGLVKDPNVVLDLCTGSGALALACKTTWPLATVIATDVSPDAADVARLNAERLGLEVEVLVGDLFGAVPAQVMGQVDLLVSNPPYVAESEWDQLPADVRAEPRLALVSGREGTEVLDRIATQASHWLAPGGLAAVEVGETQAELVMGMFGRSLVEVTIGQDLTGRDRFVTGRMIG